MDLDPDRNDLKAVVAYAMGRGLVQDSARLRVALAADEMADPLAFLAGLGGKAFGETWAPLIARFWLQRDGDTWVKQGSKQLFDVAWQPAREATPIRIELKASSEHPDFLFQQVRHASMVPAVERSPGADSPWSRAASR